MVSSNGVSATLSLSIATFIASTVLTGTLSKALLNSELSISKVSNFTPLILSSISFNALSPPCLTSSIIFSTSEIGNEETLLSVA